MIRRAMFCLLVPGALTVAGCQPVPLRTVPSASPVSVLGPLVGRDELLSTGQPMLFDALRTARPTYFRSRGQMTLTEGSMTPMVVIVNGLVLPDLETLRMTPVSEVAHVRRLTVAETFFKYNRSVSIGAIEVVMRR